MNTGIFKIKYNHHIIMTTLIEGCIYLRVSDVDHFFAFDDIEMIKNEDVMGLGNVAVINNDRYADVTAMMTLLFNELTNEDIQNTHYATNMRNFCRWLVSPEFNQQVMEYVSGWCLTWDTSDHTHFLKYSDRDRKVANLGGICNNYVRSNQNYNIPFDNKPLEEILGETLEAVENQKESIMEKAPKTPFYWGNIRCQQLPASVIHGKSRLLRNGFWTYNHRLLVVYQQYLAL
ncbi:hypothetical protein [Acetilactobacillus jinshanensis]|uniref:Uncharacterized protein n=1 Tax=Acetilactobacillus jinshanensis TaxID=1720083 RepID=A0A4P6ZKY5_9LACO|nr:hypothetical protein [Acetilactobacillus jinshanensis]QBP18436.1 hypothetical protein ELX58_04645 [Acetilactobacillus jinshanensis]URL61307.1 hypothetical protein HGK75_04750 [uncultured bacterium]